MKTYFAWVLAATLVLIGASAAVAEPQRISIKKVGESKDSAAAARIKQIDVEDIEDPTARKAISEILNYLNLKSK